MLCPKCTHEIHDSSTHCDYCGHDFKESARSIPPAGRRPGKRQLLHDFIPPEPREEEATTAVAESRPEPPPIRPENNSALNRSRALIHRYSDAYRYARVIDGLGLTVKIVGFVLAGLITLVSLPALSSRNFFGGTEMGIGIFGLLLACVVAGVGFILGTLISASGQILKSSLDGAVNNSPFLTNDERAQIMSLD